LKYMEIIYILLGIKLWSFITAANIANATPIETPEVKQNKEMVVEVTAYSSTPDQTDDTPFITANGKLVYDGVLAANFLPFGTRIKIPELYGDKIFVVEDRMHKRFQNRIDIWFPDRQSALEFGYRELKVEILEN
jgi:3D (Asp-Asp-Asp) domain-containing protein